MLEVTRSEREVAGGNFVSERFAYLTYAEGEFFTRGALNVVEVHENALCGFGAEINGACAIFGYADKSFEHKVELFDIGELFAAALRTANTLIFNELSHFFKSPARGVIIGAVFKSVVVDKFICAGTRFALLSVQKRV